MNEAMTILVHGLFEEHTAEERVRGVSIHHRHYPHASLHPVKPAEIK
jgi:hypothetical protein